MMRRRPDRRDTQRMQKVSFEELVERVVTRDPRYRPEAYLFLREALDFTQKKVTGEVVDTERHVTGQQLVLGIRDFAVEHFGPMAYDLLHEWGMRRCEDFGEIVFNLIECQVLRKTDTDSRDDFKSVYTFEEAFRDPFLPASRLAELRKAAPPEAEPV
jgi:uncharacterized repeat protein (TIGR04138 family)